MWRVHVARLVMLGLIIGYAFPAQAWDDAYGVGARATAMGGAFAAVADDYTATYYNPAGLGQIKGNIIGLEYMYVKPDIEVKNLVTGGDLKVYAPNGQVREDPTEGVDGNGLDFYTPLIGLAVNANAITDQFIKLPHIGLGALVALTGNFDNLWRIRCFPPDQPHFISYGDYTKHVLLMVNLGCEVIEKLFYIGGGIRVGIQGDATLDAVDVDNSLDPDNNNVSLEGGLSVSGKYAPCVGLLVTPLNQKLKLGYCFRGHSQVDVSPVDILANVNITVPIDIPLTGEIYASYTPDMHTLGVSYDFDKLLLACDLVYKRWSKYDYTDSEKAIYTEANREDFGMVGIIPDGPEFDDTIDIHVGAEYRWDDHIKVMGGFQRKNSPVPDQSGKITNYIDMDQNIYSLGGSYKFTKPLELTGSLRYFTFQSFSVDKTGVKGVTWGEAVDPDIQPSYLYTQNSYKVSGEAYMASIALKIGF